MSLSELYLKTLFCCSACDGKIAPDEISLIKEFTQKDNIFEKLNIELLLNSYVKQINKEGKQFLKKYIQEVGETSLSEEDQLKLIEFAIKMIEADKQVLYSEIKFFKKIRTNLSVSDDVILKAFPAAEDYLLPEILKDNKEDDWINITFSKFNLS